MKITMKMKGQGGFTILEVVFAVSILAIGIMGYTTLKSTSRFSRGYSKNLSQAIQLSGGQMEDFLARGYNDDLLSVDPTTKVGGHTDAELVFADAMQLNDFQLKSANWSVREECPSKLTKLIAYDTFWQNSGAKPFKMTQVQQRP